MSGKLLLIADPLIYISISQIRRENEQYQKREEVWQQIEDLARKNNPNFEELINRVNFMSLSPSDNGINNNNDFMNEDDYETEQYSKDVSVRRNFTNLRL